MKKKLGAWILCLAAVCALLPARAHADIGPKPSVRISFVNMGDEACYGTLLSERRSTGPAYVWDGDPQHISDHGQSREIWQAFVDYEDPDGYYFLQESWDVGERKALNWTYYPPSRFKILLYFPEQDTYVSSGILERYAFDSYFTVDMESTGSGPVRAELTAEKSYRFTQEAVSLLCRIVFTILVELGVAWICGLRSKQLMRIILRVNLVTQILLNVLLNIAGFYRGPWAFTFYYAVLEIVVFAVEAVLYRVLFRRAEGGGIPARKCIGYAFAANAASFAAGLLISRLIPAIF